MEKKDVLEDDVAIIGAIAWFNGHPEETIELFPDGSFPTDESTVPLLLNYGISKDELLARGNEAIQRGCCQGYHLRTLDPAKTGRVICRQKIRLGWDQVDGTMPYSIKEEAARLVGGPPWADNSCALDCILMVAVLINAGRIVADQQPQWEMQQLSEPACMLRRIVRKPWGVLNPKQKGQLRDVLRDSLQRHEPLFFRPKSSMSIYDVVNTLLKGIPQLTYTKAAQYKCEHSETTFHFTKEPNGPRIKASETLGLTAAAYIRSGPRPRYTITNIVESQFEWRRQTTFHGGCAQGGIMRCNSIQKRLAIIDRLPPLLMLREGFWRAENSERAGPFHRIEVSYVTASGKERLKLYTPVGCIIRNNSHFWLNWVVDGEHGPRTMSYDGLEHQGMLQDVSDLCYGLDGKAEVVLAFYKLFI